MMARLNWFTQADSPERVPRWLGILPRPLRLRIGPASHLQTSRALGSAAATIPLGLPRTNGARGLLVLEIEAGIPGLMSTRLSIGTSETVSLAGVHASESQAGSARPREEPMRSGTVRTHNPSRTFVEASLAKRLASLLQPSIQHLLAKDGPLDWPKPLLGYQHVGIQELISRESLLLADDMGLGKTIQAIAAIRILILRRRIESALVVVPAGLIAQWRTELRLWAPELRISTVHGPQNDRSWQWHAPAHVYLTSYETLRSDFSENPHSPVARVWDLIILDEAQKIKNADTELSRVCKKLKRQRQWALTGTPLENRAEDLASILDFVSPRPKGNRRSAYPYELRSELGRVQLRRRKADVLPDLPPKLVSRVVLSLTPRQRASYDRAEQEGIFELRQKGDSIQIQNVLELILRLKQICNFCPATGQSSKLIDLRERLGILTEEGHKALVFSQFSNPDNGAEAIASHFGSQALVYSGTLDQGERERVLQQFRSDPSRTILVLSLRAGGQGLNLQQASYVFHYDRWWNPAVEGQAESRSHRMGQPSPVNVYTYTCQDTIEERIEKILQEKQLLFDEIVDGVSIDLTKTLTSAELFGLFGLTAPAKFGQTSSKPAAESPIRD